MNGLSDIEVTKDRGTQLQFRVQDNVILGDIFAPPTTPNLIHNTTASFSYTNDEHSDFDGEYTFVKTGCRKYTDSGFVLDKRPGTGVYQKTFGNIYLHIYVQATVSTFPDTVGNLDNYERDHWHCSKSTINLYDIGYGDLWPTEDQIINPATLTRFATRNTFDEIIVVDFFRSGASLLERVAFGQRSLNPEQQYIFEEHKFEFTVTTGTDENDSKYFKVDGIAKKNLVFLRQKESEHEKFSYSFNQDNTGEHLITFYSDGEELTDYIIRDGDKTTIQVPHFLSSIQYKCANHAGMGGNIEVVDSVLYSVYKLSSNFTNHLVFRQDNKFYYGNTKENPVWTHGTVWNVENLTPLNDTVRQRQIISEVPMPLDASSARPLSGTQNYSQTSTITYNTSNTNYAGVYALIRMGQRRPTRKFFQTSYFDGIFELVRGDDRYHIYNEPNQGWQVAQNTHDPMLNFGYHDTFALPFFFKNLPVVYFKLTHQGFATTTTVVETTNPNLNEHTVFIPTPQFVDTVTYTSVTMKSFFPFVVTVIRNDANEPQFDIDGEIGRNLTFVKGNTYVFRQLDNGEDQIMFFKDGIDYGDKNILAKITTLTIPSDFTYTSFTYGYSSKNSVDASFSQTYGGIIEVLDEDGEGTEIMDVSTVETPSTHAHFSVTLDNSDEIAILGSSQYSQLCRYFDFKLDQTLEKINARVFHIDIGTGVLGGQPYRTFADKDGTKVVSYLYEHSNSSFRIQFHNFLYHPSSVITQRFQFALKDIKNEIENSSTFYIDSDHPNIIVQDDQVRNAVYNFHENAQVLPCQSSSPEPNTNVTYLEKYFDCTDDIGRPSWVSESVLYKVDNTLLYNNTSTYEEHKQHVQQIGLTYADLNPNKLIAIYPRWVTNELIGFSVSVHSNDACIFNIFNKSDYEIPSFTNITNNNTLNFMPVVHSDYTELKRVLPPTTSTIGQALGDPYVYPMRAPVPVKLPNRAASYCLYQSEKTFINADVRCATAEHQARMLQFVKDLGRETKRVIADGYFFSKFFVYDGSRDAQLMIDLRQRTMEAQGDHAFTISESTHPHGTRDWGGVARNVLIEWPVDQTVMSLTVSFYTNPHIENGISLSVESLPANAIGLLVHNYKPKLMRLRSLTTTDTQIIQRLGKAQKIMHLKDIKSRAEIWRH